MLCDTIYQEEQSQASHLQQLSALSSQMPLTATLGHQSRTEAKHPPANNALASSLPTPITKFPQHHPRPFTTGSRTLYEAIYSASADHNLFRDEKFAPLTWGVCVSEAVGDGGGSILSDHQIRSATHHPCAGPERHRNRYVLAEGSEVPKPIVGMPRTMTNRRPCRGG